jgi:hypothetical protein
MLTQLTLSMRISRIPYPEAQLNGSAVSQCRIAGQVQLALAVLPLGNTQ